MYGKRLIYDKNTGIIINDYLNMEGSLQEYTRPKEIEFLDLPVNYENENLKNVKAYHIDITKDKVKTSIENLIIIDEYYKIEETPEQKLLREKQELENQLLIEKDKQIGGIL